ncbi:MAG: TonB-dependent receptor plug domain-containing protein [Bacteroidia bacterium]|nr:TonB-dependent receptor plug domain-containing protein [Bacteroidia bacterium]
MKIRFVFVLIILLNIKLHAASFNFKGSIQNQKNEPIIGAVITNVNTKKNCASKSDGSFIIEANLNDKITIKSIGYKPYSFQVSSTISGISIKLTADEKELNAVNISSNKNNTNINSTQSSVITLTAKQLNNLPTIGGERDVVRAMQLMPGVKRGGDGAAGVFVRGGTADQNLVLMDGAPVYNPSHVIGFFSIFNNDALQEAKMYKGAFPANFGGRLSSVLDVKMREANSNSWKTEGGIGLLSARVKAEGPLLKNKLGLLVAARRTYLDQLFKVVGNNLPYYFYDINTKLNYNINANNKLVFSQYYGNDVLSVFESPDKNNGGLSIDFGTVLGNNVSSLKFTHLNKNAITNVYASYSYFAYDVNANLQKTNFTLRSSLHDFSIKTDYTKSISTKHSFKFGFDATRLLINPNQSTFKGDINESLKKDAAQFFNNNQLNVFGMHDYIITKRTSINYGLRISSSFNTNYFYLIPEPRLAIKYTLNQSSSLKFAYNKMSQHIHFVSSSSALMPTDLWYPVSKNVRPQTAHQISASYEKELFSKNISMQVETYYKWMQNLVEYKEGTQILLNNKVEEDLIQGNGKAYGLEILFHKKEGKLTGWVAYTLAWSSRQFNELNYGNEFFTRYDRRHDISIVANYNFTPRVSFSANFVWASGSRITPIVGQFLLPSAGLNDVLTMPIYGNRNSLVLTPSHRLDVNLVIKSKTTKKYQSEWHLGGYNIYNQTQAFKTKIEPDANGNLNYKQIGLFGFVPSIAYNIKF